MILLEYIRTWDIVGVASGKSKCSYSAKLNSSKIIDNDVVPNHKGEVIHKLVEENLFSGRHSISSHLIIEYKQSFIYVK